MQSNVIQVTYFVGKGVSTERRSFRVRDSLDRLSGFADEFMRMRGTIQAILARKKIGKKLRLAQYLRFCLIQGRMDHVRNEAFARLFVMLRELAVASALVVTVEESDRSFRPIKGRKLSGVLLAFSQATEWHIQVLCPCALEAGEVSVRSHIS